MARITRFTDTMHRPTEQGWTFPVALVVTGAALALLACGDDVDDPSRDFVTTETPAVAPVVATAADTGNAGESAAPVARTPVTFAEAESAYEERRYADAAAMFAEYVAGRPENAWGHYMLGLASWKAGSLDQAAGAFGAAIARDPEHVKSHINLARVLLELDRPAEARERIATALSIDSSSVDAHRVRGRVHAALGEPEEAIDSYRKALALDSTDVWSMNNLGLVLIRQGAYEEALPPLARAVQLDSTVAVFRNNLGIALERTGYFTLATESFRAARELGHPTAGTSLARVEGRTDDPSRGPIDLGFLAEQFQREISGVEQAAYR